jgi:hypothetical protein
MKSGGILVLSGVLAIVILPGCQPSNLSVRVDGERNILTQFLSETKVEGTGVFGDQAELKTETTWRMTFYPEKNGLREVRIIGAGFKADGREKGGSLNSELARKAIEAVDLRLTINQQGRTLSWSEDSDALKAGGLDQAVFAATATFRAIGPLGIVLPKETLKPGMTYGFMADLGPVLGLDSTKEEGTLEAEGTYVGPEKVGTREAVKFLFNSNSTFSRTLKFQGQELDVKGESKTETTAWVDKRSGLILKSEWISTNKLSLPDGVGGLTQTEKGSSQLKSNPE